MAGISVTRSLFFSGVFEYGSVSRASKAFGIPRTTYSDIIREGKTGGRSKPTVNISDTTSEKVLEHLYTLPPDERARLKNSSEFFANPGGTTYNQLNALRKERGEDSFYHKSNLANAAQKQKELQQRKRKKGEPRPRNSYLVRALREIGY